MSASASAATEVRPLLRGELEKASENSLGFGEQWKIRWFELFTDGTFQWSDREGVPAKNAISLVDSIIVLEPVEEEAAQVHYGIRVTLTTAAQVYRFRASSEEERTIWVESMDTAANPRIPSYSAGRAGRTVVVPKPTAEQPLGIDIVSEPWSPCVVVNKAAAIAAQSGLLVGDTIVAVDGTVVRSLQLAQRAFARVVSGQVTVRLAEWNREVRLIKQAGISGITLCATPDGVAGVHVEAVTRDSAAAVAGLHVGDRVFAVNGTRCAVATTPDGTRLEPHEMASHLIRASLQEVKLVVSGCSMQVDVRKDADGRLGVGFAHGPPPRGLMGAVITDVMPRGPAHNAGLRNGDLLVSVNDQLVRHQKHGIQLLSAAARALTCVVWRPNDGDGSEAEGRARSQSTAGAGGGGGGGAADEQTGAGGSGPAKVGTMPYSYYSHAIAVDAPRLPPNVALYEDLTGGVSLSGAASRQASQI